MKAPSRRRFLSLLPALGTVLARGQTPEASTAGSLPTLWLIGDSTVNNRTAGQLGWGTPFASLVDPAKARVENKALGGRSSRSFHREGLWEAVRRQLKPGDFVIIQFGHNDGGPMDREKARASIKGNGDEAKDVVIQETKQPETVRSYGWYLRKCVTEARAAGATAVVCSPVPRNIWKDGAVARAAKDYGLWAREAATQTGALFVDLNELVAARYEADGQPKVAGTYFRDGDHTHTTPEGAVVTARCVAEGLKSLAGAGFAAFFR